MLERPFIEEEIKEALFGLGDDKALGTDGFSLVFFQTYGDLVKGELLRFFHEFHANGHIVGESEASFIALIPKKGWSFSYERFSSQ